MSEKAELKALLEASDASKRLAEAKAMSAVHTLNAPKQTPVQNQPPVFQPNPDHKPHVDELPKKIVTPVEKDINLPHKEPLKHDPPQSNTKGPFNIPHPHIVPKKKEIDHHHHNEAEKTEVHVNQQETESHPPMSKIESPPKAHIESPPKDQSKKHEEPPKMDSHPHQEPPRSNPSSKNMSPVTSTTLNSQPKQEDHSNLPVIQTEEEPKVNPQIEEFDEKPPMMIPKHNVSSDQPKQTQHSTQEELRAPPAYRMPGKKNEPPRKPVGFNPTNVPKFEPPRTEPVQSNLGNLKVESDNTTTIQAESQPEKKTTLKLKCMFYDCGNILAQGKNPFGESDLSIQSMTSDISDSGTLEKQDSTSNKKTSKIVLKSKEFFPH